LAQSDAFAIAIAIVIVELFVDTQAFIGRDAGGTTGFRGSRC